VCRETEEAQCEATVQASGIATPSSSTY